MEKQNSPIKKITDNRYFCMAWLIAAVVFITWFGALKVPYEDGPGYYPMFVRTASVIAMYYSKLYYLWMVFMIAALFLNINYMYRHYDYKGKIGKVTMYAGFICIIITKIVPHAEAGIRKGIHWTAALSFGVFCAASIILFLINKMKTNKRFKITLVLFIAVLAIMIILLILFKENGAIETLPIWSAYLILFLANFTDIYKIKPAKTVSKAE
jgi:hypothetical protein